MMLTFVLQNIECYVIHLSLCNHAVYTLHQKVGLHNIKLSSNPAYVITTFSHLFNALESSILYNNVYVYPQHGVSAVMSTLDGIFVYLNTEHGITSFSFDYTSL